MVVQDLRVDDGPVHAARGVDIPVAAPDMAPVKAGASDARSRPHQIHIGSKCLNVAALNAVGALLVTTS